MKKVFLFLGLMLCVTMLQAKQIYLNANIWDVDSPAFYAHAWGGGDADVKLAKVSGTVYSGEVPDGTTSVIFLRMNPEGGFDWSKEWNRTADLQIPSGKDCFKITAWHENNDDSKPSVGEWSVYDSTTPGGGETPGGGGDCEESYGLLIDGVYYAGTKNAEPLDPSFIEYYLQGVQLTAGQYVKVHSKCADASWVITKYANTSYEFAIENDAYKVSETSTYDFYLKFKMGADEIYVSCASCKGEPVTSGSVPRQCEDVMIQAFYNESYWPDRAELGTDKYGDTKWATLLPQAEEMAHSFDLIWLPPSAYGDGMGYHPKQYSNQNSNWGTREELEALIAAFHKAGSKVVADIVINHCANKSSWCDFYENDFGEFGKFQPDASYICSNDEVNTSDEAKEKAGECYGAATGSKDDGDNWSGARDWSHDKVYVQEMFIAYLKWMRNVMKYDGFRYDKGDGFNNWHHWNYNQQAKPYIAFMESYNGTDEIQREINDAKGDLMGLDFDLKWHVFNSIAGWDYSRGRGDCIMSRGDGRHAVTFMESHDWFLRPDNENEFCGRGNSMKPEVKARLLQCNAMLLSLPGVPCVFYPHWAKYKEDLKPMIVARKAAGVHSESLTNDEEVSATGYKITVVGKRGNLILMLGDKVQGDNPASWLAENKYYKMVSNYSTMEGHNESLEIWVNMFDGSDPREYDPSTPIKPDDPVTPDPEVPENLKPNPNYRNSAPENCTDVMLQGFYWDSNELETMPGSTTSVYGSTAWARLMKNKSKETGEYIADEMGKWFDLIWLPPFSRSTGGTGYLPIQYSSLESAWGTKTNLNKLIKKLHSLGARVIEDIVINHGQGEPSWCTFAKQDFGEYGTYQPTASWICRTDDLNWSEEAKEDAGDCFGKASGNNDAGYDGLDDFKGGRDWDHQSKNVQLMCKAYLKWLINNVHVDGFRYDYCKGFKNGYIADYNSVANPYFTVMEMWDGRVGDLQYHLNEARRTSTTFDFATKFSAFNDGIANGNYGALKGCGLLGAGESRYAVTFIDNHDTFLRKDDNGFSNEFLGYGNSLANDENKAKVLQCNAFILSMPGVPCVFFPHWITFKKEIKAMIDARYKTGVHSQSRVEDEAGHDYYKATIYGTNGEIRLLMGPASGYNTTPAGYTLASKGVNYGVYYKMTTPRGSKETERTPIAEGIEDVFENQDAVKAEKFIQNGQLYIRLGDKVYDIMGRVK